MEKSSATAEIKGLDGSSTNSPEPETIAAPRWSPGYLARFPILGALAIAGVLLCTASTVAVLVGSNNVSQTRWPKQIAPNVCLSGINSLSNILLVVAIQQGIPIAWWRRAMKGATVSDLHQSWEFSMSMMSILEHLLSWDKVAIAALATKFAVVDGILFQRATTTYIAQDPVKSISTIGIAAMDFPKTGYVVDSNKIGAQANCGCFMIGDAYTDVVNTWETSNGFFRDINDWFRTPDSKEQHCDGTCYTNIDAIGFEIDCTGGQPLAQDIAKAPIAAWEANANGTSGDKSQWTDIAIFNSSFGLVYAEGNNSQASLSLNLYYFQSDNPYNPSDRNCAGRVYNTTCSLRPALITYPVKIMNYSNPHIINGVSLGLPTDKFEEMNVVGPPAYNRTLKQAQGFKVGAPIYVDDSHTLGGLTSLGGLANALSQFMSSTATISYNGESSGLAAWGLDQKGTLSQTLMYGPPNMGSCDCSFRSESLDYLVQGINQLAFLTAVGTVDGKAFANKQVKLGDSVPVIGVGENSTATFRQLEGGQQISDVIHYSTNFTYMGIGIAAVFICLAMVVPAFWRYGELGRKVTLGPIEIASAFRAPMLTGGRTVTGEANGDVDAVIRDFGHKKVMYGLVESPHSVASGSAQGGSTVNRQSSFGLAMENPDRVRPVSVIYSSPNSPSVTSPTTPRFR